MKFIYGFAAVSCLAASAAFAQSVFVLPGPSGSAQTAQIFSGNSLTPAGSFSAPAGAYLVIGNVNSSKYYVISKAPGANIIELDPTFSNPKNVGTVPGAAIAAALSPDGTKLLVAVGSALEIIDTGSDAVLGISSLGGTAVDLDVALDGSRAFVLTSNAGAGTLYAVNLTSYTASNPVLVGGSPTAVAVGPNDLVYVSVAGSILELDPVTLSATAAGAIAVDGQPGKAVVTPDGVYLLAGNQSPTSGSLAYAINLGSHSVSKLPASAATGGSLTLDKLVPVSASMVLGFSSQASTLVALNIAPSGALTLNAPLLPGIVTTQVSGITTTSEIAGGGGSAYVIAGGVLYRYALNNGNGTIAAQQTVTLAATSVPVVVTPAATGGPAGSLLVYGANQTLAPSANSSPLVARVLDSSGHPLSGATVNFTTNAGQLSAGSVVTTRDGYAVVRLAAPNTAQTVTVAATAGSVTNNFTIIVSQAAAVGGAPSGLAIVSGQGQILSAVANSQPLVVRLSDVNGNPIVSANITYTLTGGTGAFVSSLGASATAVAVTDQNGLAQATVRGTATNSFTTLTITAASSSGFSVTFNETVLAANVSAIILGQTPAFGSTLQGQAGQTLTGAIKLLIETNQGTPIPNVGFHPVFASPGPQQPSATCAGASANGGVILSDQFGNINCDLILGPVTGTTPFTIDVGETPNTATYNLTVTAGPVSKLNLVQGNNQVGAPGVQLPLALVIQATDAFGNSIAGATVTWAVDSASGSLLVRPVATTSYNGQASSYLRLGPNGGTTTVTAASNGVTATFTETTSSTVASVTVVSGNSQNATISTAFANPIVVMVTDTSGKPVTGIPVVFAVTGGVATLGVATVNTDASGRAMTTVTAGAGAGAITITATVGAQAATFTLTANPPGPPPPTGIVAVNGASFQNGVAPCSIALIQGSNIASGISGLQLAPKDATGALPTTLQNVQVLFGTTAAPILYVNPGSGGTALDTVAVQVPCDAALGNAPVTVTNASKVMGSVANVTVSQYAPALFTNSSGGTSEATAVRPDGSLVSPSNPARRGENVCLFATGLGQTTPAITTNTAGSSGQVLSVALFAGVGNNAAQITSATYASTGVYRVCLTVPTSTQTGPSVPVGLIIAPALNVPLATSAQNMSVQ